MNRSDRKTEIVLAHHRRASWTSGDQRDIIPLSVFIHSGDNPCPRKWKTLSVVLSLSGFKKAYKSLKRLISSMWVNTFTKILANKCVKIFEKTHILEEGEQKLRFPHFQCPRCV